MPIKIQLIEDDEIRAQVRAMVEGQVKAIVREQLEVWVKAEVERKVQATLTEAKLADLAKWGIRSEAWAALNKAIAVAVSDTLAPCIEAAVKRFEGGEAINELARDLIRKRLGV